MLELLDGRPGVLIRREIVCRKDVLPVFVIQSGNKFRFGKGSRAFSFVFSSYLIELILFSRGAK